MTDIEIYKAAVYFVLNLPGITKEDLDIQLVSKHNKPNDLKIIYQGLCASAQNKQMSTKVIGNSIDGVDNLRNVLFNFDPHLVAKQYAKTDGPKLLSDIKEILNPKGQIRTTSRSLWPQFCQSIIDSAYFLKSFDSATSFYEWADFFANDSKAKPALPLMISMEIAGIGFPLACDFLKELGYIEYGKPDVHLKDIFKALGIIDKNEKSVTKQDYETLKAIDRIAKANHVTPYAVDKVFWLIGSGIFHLAMKNVGSQKKSFIASLTRKTKY